MIYVLRQKSWKFYGVSVSCSSPLTWLADILSDLHNHSSLKDLVFIQEFELEALKVLWPGQNNKEIIKSTGFSLSLLRIVIFIANFIFVGITRLKYFLRTALTL